ncbi:metallophosphoesterase [uncultured Faecalibaculum sp.]|uniref:metallophosphoesterase n=1 Tax=uncultured Faecalibaculum sp. TaxID=1729681 RepID=UPI00260AF148|nr:metallophosphoesterase [uncultured Faecalibaculum sp.]
MMILYVIFNLALALFLAWDTWRLIPVWAPGKKYLLLILLAAVFLFCSMTTTAGYSLLVYYAVFLLTAQVAMRLTKKTWKLSAAVPAVCVILAGAVTVWGLCRYDDRTAVHYTIETDKKAAGRIVFLSDLHYPTGMSREELNNLTEALAAEKADVYILGGDIVDEYTTADQARDVFAKLGTLSRTAPVVYVPGNHDDQEEGILPPAYSGQELTDMIEESGIRILKDDTVTIGDFLLAGRDDYRQHKKDRAQAAELVQDTNRFVVMIDHQPVQSEQVREAGADLMMSGHTHDGQLWPFGYLIHLHPSMDLVSGIRQADGFTQITSDGIGGWGFPVRTAGQSEYVVVDVKPEEKS